MQISLWTDKLWRIVELTLYIWSLPLFFVKREKNVMKKKIALMIVACTMALSLVGCTTTKTVTVTDENGNTVTTETVNGQETVYYEKVPMLIANELDADLAEVYLCISGSENWGDNIVPEGEVFPNERTINGLNVTYYEGDTMDVLLYDENGENLEIDDIDLSPAEGKAFALVLEYDEDEESYFAYVEQQ